MANFYTEQTADFSAINKGTERVQRSLKWMGVEDGAISLYISRINEAQAVEANKKDEREILLDWQASLTSSSSSTPS